MILTTTATIAGYRLVETKGLVRGSTIRAKHVGKDILAGLRTLVGGEIKEYTKMMAESREEATQRMISAAEELGANASHRNPLFYCNDNVKLFGNPRLRYSGGDRKE